GGMQCGAHGTPFGGKALAAAVARVALRKLASPEIMANVGRQAATLRAGLEAVGGGLFSGVRGRGLMLGAVLAPAHAGRAGELLDLAAAEGLLLLQAGPDVLRLVPPLNITDAEVGAGPSRLEHAMRRATEPARASRRCRAARRVRTCGNARRRPRGRAARTRSSAPGGAGVAANAPVPRCRCRWARR